MISIIVPVYNVEKYLRKCIDSVLAQTYTDWELLLIDDGSTDSSGKICDEYAKTDDRIKTFHKNNGGSSSARNQGIKLATGEWIYFLDSDDWIIPSCFELMLECVDLHHDTELVHAGIKATYGHEYMSMEDKEFPSFSNNKEWISQTIFRTWVVPFNNLIKRNFIIRNSLSFDISLLMYEDEVWTFDLSLTSPILAFCFHDTYIYNWRDNSKMTKSIDINKKLRDYCLMWNKEIDHLEVANDHRPWFIKKIWHHIFHFYDAKCDSLTAWKIRLLLWRLASHSTWKMAIAIIMSSTLTKTFIDKYLYRRFIFGQLLWEKTSCNPLL